MIPAIETYQDCCDLINVQENGQFSYNLFNRYSWIGQLRMLDWLSGDVKGVAPPEPYRTQKNRDWLSPFVKEASGTTNNGRFDWPEDYYLYQDFYVIDGTQSDCEDDDVVVVKNPIVLFDTSKFNNRCRTKIKSLVPSIKKPICKQIGKSFRLMPEDIGTVTLEYIRYPQKAVIATKVDTVYNQVIPDPAATIDFEWDEFARPVLVFYIADAFANRNREQALKQTNLVTNKLDREGIKP